MRFEPQSASTGRKPFLSFFAGAALLAAAVPAAAAPGAISFTASTLSVGEAGLVATLTLQRTGGTDNVVSVTVSTANGTATAGADYDSTSEVITWAAGESANKTVNVAISGDEVPEASETFTATISEPLGGATVGSPSTITVTIGDDDVIIGPCEPNSQTLCLGQGQRFQVRADFEAPSGAAGAAQSFTIAQRDSGIFWFFNLENPELLVKVLDGCSINNRYWVLYAATTDVRFDLHIADTQSGAVRTYQNAQGHRADSVIDLNGFATCPDITDESGQRPTRSDAEIRDLLSNPIGGIELTAVQPAIQPVAGRETVFGTCVDDATTLCLNIDGRFQVRVTYSAFDGASGDAKATHLSLRDGGLFYFFDPNNAEMLIKVLDGCSINNRFWVLFAGATDVQFTVTVVDTQTGESKTYENELGHRADAVIDIEAFGNCAAD